MEQFILWLFHFVSSTVHLCGPSNRLISGRGGNFDKLVSKPLQVNFHSHVAEQNLKNFRHHQKSDGLRDPKHHVF